MLRPTALRRTCFNVSTMFIEYAEPENFMPLFFIFVIPVHYTGGVCTLQKTCKMKKRKLPIIPTALTASALPVLMPSRC